MRQLLPPDWEARAQRATDELRSATPEERPKVIERRAGLWRELTSLLGSLSFGKCWYCESKQFRSDNAVDHFRPKRRVVECEDHPGYWWLAFAWINYRFSCTLCNSRRREKLDDSVGGKHDHFPLTAGSPRAYAEDDDCSKELPELLDPTLPGDTVLLQFADDGRVYPRYAEDSHAENYQRAMTSIKLYNLNHRDIVEARKLMYKELLARLDHRGPL